MTPLKLPFSLTEKGIADLTAVRATLEETVKQPAAIERKLSELAAKLSEVTTDIARLEPITDGCDDQLVLALTARREQARLLGLKIEQTREQMYDDFLRSGRDVVIGSWVAVRVVIDHAAATILTQLTQALEPYYSNPLRARQAAAGSDVCQALEFLGRFNLGNIEHTSTLIGLAMEQLKMIEMLLAGELPVNRPNTGDMGMQTPSEWEQVVEAKRREVAEKRGLAEPTKQTEGSGKASPEIA